MCHPGKPLPHGLSHSICRFSPGGREFPQREVGRMFLFPEVHALAGFLSLDVEPREVSVVRLLRGVEIDAVGGPISVAVLLDVGDEFDLLGDMVGRAAQHRRVLDVQQLHVGDESVGVEPGDFPCRLARAPRALLHLVLAGVGVRGEMADIGDVHHVPHAISVPLEHPLQHVLEQERPVVADVLVVVDRRPAGVQPDVAAGMKRLERAQRACEIVVEVQRIRHVTAGGSGGRPPTRRRRKLIPSDATALNGGARKSIVPHSSWT